MPEEKKKDIGGLWEQTSQKGVVYLSGTINGQKVVLFQNTYKKPGENGPDWRVYPKDDNQTSPAPAQAAQTPPAQRSTQPPSYTPTPAFPEDDIPF